MSYYLRDFNGENRGINFSISFSVMAAKFSWDKGILFESLILADIWFLHTQFIVSIISQILIISGMIC